MAGTSSERPSAERPSTYRKVETMAKKDDPFNANPDAPEDEQDPTTLGDAAQSALSDIVDGAAVQDPLEGTDYLKVKFVGMSMDSLDDDISLGDQITFTVQARCIGNGVDLSKQDGHEKRYVKMDVQSVVISD